jgi:hypothetical protein
VTTLLELTYFVVKTPTKQLAGIFKIGKIVQFETARTPRQS